MALNQTNKLVWIVDTIYKARKITFEELNRQWRDNVDMSGGEELLKRTFHKWKWSIFDTFGLMIECEEWRGHGSARTAVVPQGDCREDKEDVKKIQ